jgi:Ca2+-binding EF-hand superfamily protein
MAAIAQMPPHDHDGMRPPVTRSELQAKIADQFKAADTNGDGFVTKAEFDARRDAMRQKFEAKRAEHRDREFTMLDTNHDGSLSKSEFMTPPPHGHDGPGGRDMPPGADPEGGPDDGPGGHGHHWRGHGMRGGHMGMGMMGGKWFDRADASHDGKLTLAEASAGPLAMFDRVDTNHDGTISPEERKAAREMFRDRMKDKRD